MTTTTYHILINPAAASGRGRKVWKKIRPELERLGVSYRQFFPATPDHAREIIQHLEGESWGTGTMTHFSLHSEQPSMYAKNESLYPSPLTHPLHLIVVGGDGTMSTVVNSINDFTRFRIGYIPAGSANDLALSLGLSDDPLENLSSILEGIVRRHLDIGVAETGDKGDGSECHLLPKVTSQNRPLCHLLTRRNLMFFLRFRRLSHSFASERGLRLYSLRGTAPKSAPWRSLPPRQHHQS